MYYNLNLIYVSKKSVYIFIRYSSFKFSIKWSLPKSIKTIIVISTITMQVVAGKPIMLFLLDLVNNPMIDGMFVFHFLFVYS